MSVIYLRNSTRTGLLTKAEENGFTFDGIPESGETAQFNGHARFIYKGKIGNNDATYDGEGNELTPETLKSGWHADLILTCHHTAEEFDFGDMVREVLTPETDYGL